MNIELPHDWTPRTYQVPVWKYFQGPAEGKRAICVWHRRAGKDVLAINLIATKLFERVGTYWHCLPFYRQARDVVWNGKTREGRPFMSFFPKQLIKNKLNNEMRIHFLNPNEPDEDGSIYQAVGTDDKDRLVGTNPIGVVFSEYSLCNESVWHYVRPILRENGGWALFIYTPRGKNHGYDLLDTNKGNPDWFVDVRKAGSGPDGTKKHDGTPVYSDDDIQKDRAEGMPEELIQQEYFVSFEASLVGAYYSKQMEKAETEGRICQVAYDPKLPVETAWDIGWNDATSIIFFQRHFTEIRIIDFYENSGEGLPHYVRVMREKEYIYGAANFPHDLSVTEWASGKSRVEVARGLGLKVRIVPHHEVMDGIEQCRNILPRCIFNGSKCGKLITALKAYRKEYDEERKVFKEKPVHDFSSHAADSFRYLCWTVKKSVTKDPFGEEAQTTSLDPQTQAMYV